MRLANEICAAAMEHVRARASAGDEGERSRRDLAGVRARRGDGLEAARRPGAAVLAGVGRPGIRTFTATGDRAGRRLDQPTLFEIWVCADGYWCDDTKLLCPASCATTTASSSRACMGVYERAIDHCRPGASFAELDRLVRDGIAAIGYPGQPTHPICHGVGARTRAAVRASGRRRHDRGGNGAGDRAVLLEGGGGLRVEDNFLITADGAEQLSSFPDGVVRVDDLIWTGC